ncbi:ABC exporter membrane fusion protein [Spirulina sp. 06S082]|uniref:ABC exporter membrane fusion protein n=1 Tax=Spirulina sp. 06S082 TaxID=3110248 RepID=UPI002B2163D1|nr:ABC exporter membrane fusion protein [Spirulina sp. 06S082]MEA5468602.1 ABC exporter membrane fusion protein [Spirulina sp. 06S082]
MNDKLGVKRSLFTQKGKGWIVGLSIGGLLVVGATAIYSVRTLQQLSASTAEESEVPELPKIEAVTALGRLEPLGEVIQVAASPSSTTGGAKVERLLVREGDRVRANQIIAQLDSYDRLNAAVNRAKEDVAVAEANLAVVKAGAKQGEITAQQATIQRLREQLRGESATQAATVSRIEAELRNAETEYKRYEQLYQEGAISTSERDTRALTLATTRERVTEAKENKIRTEATLDRQIREAIANLDRISEVRPVEIRQAQASVDLAEAAVRQAREDLELSVVRSPITGQILEVNTHVGEVTETGEGIIAIGKTDRMVVVAEVYESDISRVRIDREAIIKSENGSFEGELRGKVSNIGLQIGKKDVLDTDPAADVDARVIEVDILLSPEDSQRVSGLTNAKVLVEILL